MARKAQNTDTADQGKIDPVDALPTVTLSGAVPALLSEAVELHRWQNRKTRADVLKEAVHEWAEKHNLLDPARERLAAQVADKGDDSAE